MAVVVLLLVVTAVAAGAYFLARRIRRRRNPRELRGDWWAAFERDFQAYTSAVAKRRGRGERGSAGR